MSRVVLLTKKDVSLRLCIDFRALKHETARHTYPLDRTDDILSRMKGCRYLTSLHVQAAFWKVQVAPRISPRLPSKPPLVSLSGWPCHVASSTFQWLTDTVLTGCTNNSASIDDCFVASET